MNKKSSTFKLFMKNGQPYQVQLCIEPETQHTPEYLKCQIANALESMSSESRWQRFASPIRSLSDKQLDYLVSLDGKDKVAWCASIIETDNVERGIGLARYIKIEDKKKTAEFAITVVDEFQRQGVGSTLLKKLLESAKSNGFKILRGYILPSNNQMLSLAKQFGACFHSGDSTFVIADIAT